MYIWDKNKIHLQITSAILKFQQTVDDQSIHIRELGVRDHMPV